jgi:cobalamin biosynthesis Mg chelatase CobN
MSDEQFIERLALAVRESSNNSNEQAEPQTQEVSGSSTSTTTTTTTVVEQVAKDQVSQESSESKETTAQVVTTTTTQTPQVATAKVAQATPQVVAVDNSASAGATPYSTSTTIPGHYILPPLSQPPPPFSVNMNVQQARPVANPFIQLSSIFTKARAVASAVAQQATSQEAKPLWVAGIIGLLGALGIFFLTQQSRRRKKEEV